VFGHGEVDARPELSIVVSRVISRSSIGGLGSAINFSLAMCGQLDGPWKIQ
jgi:hypothetical protein